MGVLPDEESDRETMPADEDDRRVNADAEVDSPNSEMDGGGLHLGSAFRDDDLEFEIFTQSFSSNAASSQNSFGEQSEDRYRSKTVLLATVSGKRDLARRDRRKFYGEADYAVGLPWRLMVCPNERADTGVGLFVACDGDSAHDEWSCRASVILSMLSQDPNKKDISRSVDHVFSRRDLDFGFFDFVTFDVCDPANGYVKDDTIEFRAVVMADAPRGVKWDSKKRTDHVGLKNQGATCYLNSVLQTFFFTNVLRKAIYQMPADRFEPERSVALAMQRVFYRLQTSSEAVCTRQLTQSFGWDSSEAFQQHDVQELCRVLLENVERNMRGTLVEGTIAGLFRGEMKSYVRCANVDFESSRSEFFYDVQLNIAGKKNVQEAFAAYIAEETLDGENSFDAGLFGLQPAVKGVKFVSFPVVLYLQLMRFQYDYEVDANSKVNDRFEFPELLSLDEFLEERTFEKEYEYVLHAVLVHSGTPQFGHYVVFINTEMTGDPKWCKFDDDYVSVVSPQEAIDANFGGDDDVTVRHHTSAYMLVYVKTNSIDDVFCAIDHEDVPGGLRELFEREICEERGKEEQKLRAKRFVEVTVLLEHVFYEYDGLDLFTDEMLEESPRLRVPKRSNVQELYEDVASKFNLKKQAFRIWVMDTVHVRSKFRGGAVVERLRPRGNLDIDVFGTVDVESISRNDRLAIFLELPFESECTPQSLLTPCNFADDCLIFVKYFDFDDEKVFYVGHTFVPAGDSLMAHKPRFGQLVGLPPEIELHLYPESLKERHESDEGVLFRADGPLNVNIFNGALLVMERADRRTQDYNALVHCTLRESMVTLEAIPHPNESEWTHTDQTPRTVKGVVSLKWSLKRLAEWIASELDCDDSFILFWKPSRAGNRPCDAYFRDSDKRMFEVEILLPEIDDSKVRQIYYSRMPFPVRSFTSRRSLSLQCLNAEMLVARRIVFVEEDGTAQSILDEVQPIYPFSPKGTGLLRLVTVSSSPPHILKVLDSDVKLRWIGYDVFLRVDELADDEKVIGADEALLTVAHYDRNPSNLFGISFFMKVKHGETVGDVCERIKKRLHVDDRDFSRYKFSLFFDGNSHKELTFNDVVDFDKVNRESVCLPWLGMDHIDKERRHRASLGGEQPIVIYN